MLGIVISEPDDASVHVRDHLLDLADWTRSEDDETDPPAGGGHVYRTPGAELRTFDDRHLDLVGPAPAFDEVDVLAFAARHAGETGPLLTAHHTGNVGPADHGGEPRTLARACPAAFQQVFGALERHAPPGYDVGMECTHHGPTAVGCPSLFVEVGSGPEQWADPPAARAVAAAILSLRGVGPDRPAADGTVWTRRHVIGFGGGHYAPRFERLTRDTDWAVGHVAADWGLDALGDVDSSAGRSVVEAVFTQSRAAYGLIVGDRPGLRAVVDDLGYRLVDERWLRETDGIPLDLVRQVEAALEAAAGTIRFGESVTGDISEVVVDAVPPALLEAARGIDLAATRAALQAETLAFAADQGGTRPTGPIARAADDDADRLIDRLARVLADHYDAVERAGDELVVRETAFLPDRARALGVPEGPAFGRLAAGEAVEVEDRVVTPEAVTERRERRFQLR